MGAIRFGGIASGIDTDQIVKDLMKVERTKVDRLEQNKILNTWKQESYNDLNKEFANFILDTKKDFELTKTTSTGVLINSSVSNISWAKGANSSNENIATVSSSSSAVEGSFGVNVTQLASNVTMASKAKILNSVDSSPTTDLATQFSNINTGDNIHFTISNGTQSVVIDNSAENLSIEDIVKNINDADIGITAVYDSSIERFFLQTDDTGKDNSISITNEADGNINFLTNLNLSATYQDYSGGTAKGVIDTVDVNYDGTVYQGGNAFVDFAGANDIEKSTNEFSINGISLDLKSIGSTTVKVDTDVDKVYDKIKSFVDSYNELIDKVGTKLSEKQYRDFKPLTTEQRESMSDSEVEMWEEKAKSGLLRNDGMFTRTMDDMRSGLYDSVTNISGSFSNLFDIGITTEKYASGTIGGKLQIDEDTLRESIRDDVNGVLELLFKQPDSSLTDETAIEKDSGIITRLYDNMIDGMKNVIDKAGPGNDANIYRNVKSNMLIDFITTHGSISMIDKSVFDIEDSIIDMNESLSRIEDGYWRKFTAMEKAISQMQSQGDWLMSQMGG